MVVKILYQSETLIPQIVGFYFTKILQSGEFSLITYVLRNIQFSFQVQIPQIVGFWCTKKTYRVRNFFDFLQSEEYSEHNSVSDSSDCRILMCQKTYRVGNFFIFLQSEEYSEFKSVSDSSDCRISNMIKATKWGSLKNERLASMSYSSR